MTSLATGGTGFEGRIGPNAITRLAETLEGVEGKGAGAKALSRAGLAAYVAAPPDHMVDEAEVIALHAAVRATYGDQRAQTLAWIAGRKTGDYLLAHRVPKPMQAVLKLLPAPLAARVLLAAIKRHAWTFAGSGRFSVACQSPLSVEIADCPLCRGHTAREPSCAYFAATLERLFAALVHPDATVRETACAAMGAPACQFEIGWRRWP